MSTSTPAAAAPAPFFQLRSPPGTALPRLGSVLGRVSTPAVLTYTQHGLPPHLTIDLWRHLPDMTAFHITLAALVEQPSAAALASSHSPLAPTLASYLHYPPSSFLLLSLSDPLLPAQQCSDTSLLVASPQGNLRVAPLHLVQRARTLRPDALLLASDGFTASSEADANRERKAVRRTLRWVKEQLNALYGESDNAAQASEVNSHDGSDSGESGERRSKRQRLLDKQEEAIRRKTRAVEAAAASDNAEATATATSASAADVQLSAARHTAPPHIVVPLPLTSNAAEQQLYMGDILAHKQLLDGFSVAVPPVNSDAALSLLPSVLSQLPVDSLRHCSSHPPSLSSLFAVACSGIDLISTALPTHHSLQGRALSLHSPALSLHSTQHVTSALPLAADCPCYTCAHHTRAYVHHLLRVKEMTATVLLDIHNTHVVMEAMRLVRERLAAAVDEQSAESWQKWRDEWLHKLEANEELEKEEFDREKQKETAGAPAATSDDSISKADKARSNAPVDTS